ncbi:MAG: sugar ABC transporter permease [Deinococcus-Thermus bacterium]|nr:MAG: sugar ABC transporter permease [Deinococcota bacterium]
MGERVRLKEATPRREGVWVRLVAWLERQASAFFLLPTVLVILAFVLFPLVGSLYSSLSRLRFSDGGLELSFVGLANYRKVLLGSEQIHFLGQPGAIGWVMGVMGLLALGIGVVMYRRYRAGRPVWTWLGQPLLGGLLLLGFAWLFLSRLWPGTHMGTLQTTLFYVLVGTALQYLLGLGLALLCAERLPGTRFFRVLFILPLAITPIGVAYMFRMLTDTGKGPLVPLWEALGWGGFSWVNDPWGARLAVLIGDVWQWTPFAFIVLLAALQSVPQEQVEAAAVDGASRWQIFRHIIFPYLLPASATLVLIRLIEGFKIVDLPNILTNGGPGTATESITLHAYFAWRTLDIGTAAALGFLLMLLVSLVTSLYAAWVLPRARGQV